MAKSYTDAMMARTAPKRPPRPSRASMDDTPVMDRSGRRMGEGNYVDTSDKDIADTSGPLSTERAAKREMLEQDLQFAGGRPGGGRPYTFFGRRATKGRR